MSVDEKAVLWVGSSPADVRAVVEIRVHTEGEFRVFYVAKFEEAVHVLHAFEKKAPKREIDLARGRYAELVSMRRQWRS